MAREKIFSDPVLTRKYGTLIAVQVVGGVSVGVGALLLLTGIASGPGLAPGDPNVDSDALAVSGLVLGGAGVVMLIIGGVGKVKMRRAVLTPVARRGFGGAHLKFHF